MFKFKYEIILVSRKACKGSDQVIIFHVGHTHNIKYIADLQEEYKMCVM